LTKGNAAQQGGSPSQTATAGTQSIPPLASFEAVQKVAKADAGTSITDLAKVSYIQHHIPADRHDFRPPAYLALNGLTSCFGKAPVDEPPSLIKMCTAVDFMDHSFTILGETFLAASSLQFVPKFPLWSPAPANRRRPRPDGDYAV
jgi:hypothetical protein